MSPRASKLQRWTDLLAALLRRHYPATFDDLARDIPGYLDSSKKKDALMRMFERDKDELRSFGIAIETQQIEDGEATGYRLEKKGFYLPYLSLAREGKGASQRRKPDKYGYRALGDPVLTEEVDSAIRKLAFDLPLRDVESVSDPERAVHAAAPRDSVFEAMNDALTRRKSVTFDYRTMATDKSSRRTIEPYGLFFLSSHWYVAGRDPDRLELRNFRPMGLTIHELCALELGLAMLRAERPPDETVTIDRARDRLRKVIAKLPPDHEEAGQRYAELAPSDGLPFLTELRKGRDCKWMPRSRA
ncbi:MAG: WYL domain-containing protein [Gemmatimonadaceae bacterium]|nr:WYL domain-containing protein [Gemmatimonadaceae bacterium]